MAIIVPMQPLDPLASPARRQAGRDLGRLTAAALLLLAGCSSAPPKPRPGAAPRNHLPVQTMVCCAHCGLHLPQAEASAANGQFFCSPAHQQRGARQP